MNSTPERLFPISSLLFYRVRYLGAILLLTLFSGQGRGDDAVLLPTNYRVRNISITGPATLDESDGWRTYTVSFDIQRLNGFSGAIDVVVWLMDKDSDEAFRDGDDFLSFRRVHIAANQTNRTTTLQLIGFQMKVWGTAVTDPAGNSNDRDSGEGGPSWVGPNPAEIYANISNFKSSVRNVVVQH